MDNDLLVSLVKYSPRNSHNPAENFLTEAFSWLLRQSDEFSCFFLARIIPNLENKYTGWKWSTQVNFNGFFPDMVATCDNAMVVFEHKISSELSENQIRRYRDHAADIKNTQSWVVLITASTTQHTEEALDCCEKCCCWYDVHKTIEEWIDTNKTSDNTIFSMFQKLLEHQGLGPAAPVSHEAILSYLPAQSLVPTLKALMQRAITKDWLQKGSWSEGELNEVRDDRCGRLGISLFGLSNSDWYPGVFVGFMLDGSDHRAKPLDNSKGPDFTVIISFGSQLHDSYRNFPEYKALIKRLSNAFSKDLNFYHHLEDDGVDSKNLWHPIHIRCSMLDVFRGTKTSEEQDAAFASKATEALEVLFKEDEILRMRQQYSQAKAA